MRTNLLPIIILGSMLCLGACDGDSGSHHKNDGVVVPTDDNDSTQIGFLIDSAVSGLTYETATHQGVTGSEGDFKYEEGETVRFMIGDTLLGEVIGQEQLTPFDLAGSEMVTGTPQIAEALDNNQHPFRRVINTVVLLQSADSDGNPDNGIEILPEVAALFEGVTLDVAESSWESFHDDPQLTRIIRRANTLMLFTEAHGVAQPAAALAHLYDTLGVEANILGESRVEVDFDGDNSADEIQTFEYDTSGYLTRSEYHDGGDPLAMGNITRSQYDSRGNLTEQVIEALAGCLPQQGVIRWQYDAGGNVTQITWDWDAAGVSELTERWQYGQDGSVSQTNEFDWGGDGKPGSICDLVFDGNTAEWVQLDFTSDGTPDYVEQFEYDANGSITRLSYDQDGDGVPDYIEIWEHNEDGNLTRYTKDQDGDGTPETSNTYEYNENGEPIRESYDEDGDGIADTIMLSEYDENGHSTRDGFDDNGDGEIDRITELREYDADGNEIRHEVDFGLEHFVNLSEFDADGNLRRDVVIFDRDRDGTPDEIQIDEFDENFSNTRHEEDENGDGIPEEIEISQYHANGQVMRTKSVTDRNQENDYMGDGIPDSVDVQEYDVNGNQVLAERDEDADGKPEGIETWQYNDDGNLTTHTLLDGNRNPEYVEYWEYDDYGNVTRYTEDADGDDTVDRSDTWHYEYDANGKLTQKAWDAGNDGVIDTIENWQYDADGNLTRAAVDENGDGTPEVTTIEYVRVNWGYFFPSSPPRDPRGGFRFF